MLMSTCLLFGARIFVLNNCTMMRLSNIVNSLMEGLFILDCSSCSSLTEINHVVTIKLATMVRLKGK